MRLTFERQLPCPPTVAWSLVLDPPRRNLWSVTPIHASLPGDGGHVSGVGAVRRVGRASSSVDEVITRAEPAERAAYRVFGAPGERRHEGRIEFVEADGGTHLRWEVDVEYRARRFERRGERRLLKELGGGLDRITRATLAAPPLEPAPRRTGAVVGEASAISALLAEARRGADETRALAEELIGLRDDRGWFLRYRADLMDLHRQAVEAGRFAHPAWVLRVLLAEDDILRHNAELALDHHEADVETHWRRAFGRMSRARRTHRRRAAALAAAIAAGIQTQTDEDTPRALARTYISHYSGHCDYARFRADYLAMDILGRRAALGLLSQVSPGQWPLGLRLTERVLGVSAMEGLLTRHAQTAFGRRRKAFERGGRIAELIAEL